MRINIPQRCRDKLREWKVNFFLQTNQIVNERGMIFGLNDKNRFEQFFERLLAHKHGIIITMSLVHCFSCHKII